MISEEKFPDGQINFKANTEDIKSLLTPPYILSNDNAINFTIDLSNWDKFQTLLAANAKFRQTHKQINLHIGYLFGSRSDRKFEHDGINYFRDVIAKTINDQNFNKVTVFDPHSLAVENAINNCESIHPFPQINHHFLNMVGNLDLSEYEIVIASPDLGAYKKVFGIFAKFSEKYPNIHFNFISANKIRSLSGDISMVLNPPYKEFDKSKKRILYLIDDICDGGRTFIEFAKLLNEDFEKKYLYVSHGIFSKGLDPLLEHFDKIFTTNSISNTYIKYLTNDNTILNSNILFTTFISQRNE